VVTESAPGSDDPVIEALDRLVEALARNIEASEVVAERARTVKELRARGLAYKDIADETGAPLVVQLVTENLDRLRVHGAQLRQAHAAALYEEGMTMDQIAALFGVTRQRISALLRPTKQD
jgi:DNA-binding CsgD family transcriptional regulator